VLSADPLIRSRGVGAGLAGAERRWFGRVVLGAALGLTGCAGPGRRQGVVGRPTSDGFELSGRIAVQYDGDGYSGTLRWLHAMSSDLVELYAPVGTLYARLRRDPSGAVMETADGKRFDEPDTGALSRRVLGWELPLEELPHWVFGRSAPGGAPARVDNDTVGRPARLVQAGWVVSYRSYMEDQSEVLPSRMDLERPGLRVKLIISRWAETAARPS